MPVEPPPLLARGGGRGIGVARIDRQMMRERASAEQADDTGRAAADADGGAGVAPARAAPGVDGAALSDAAGALYARRLRPGAPGGGGMAGGCPRPTPGRRPRLSLHRVVPDAGGGGMALHAAPA